MNKRLLPCVAFLLATALSLAEEAAPKLEPKQRWVFSFSNFANEDAVTKLTALMKRARQAGYTGILVSDVKFEKFQLQPPAVAARLKKFRQDCTAEKMKFIAGVTAFGYADCFLTNDPNLCEGLPVRNATFVVKDGKLVPFDDAPRLVNPSFDEFKNNNPVGWFADDPGTVSFADEQVKCDGKSSLRQQDPAGKRGNARASQKFKVKPWQYYHVTVMVKTEDWLGRDMRIMGFAGNPDGGMPLNWQVPKIEKTMDWTRIDASFDTLDNTEVSLYLGTWGAKTGKIWWDDVRIEPAGFVNIIRRDSLPLAITSEDGKTTYEEGKEFLSAVQDPKMLNDPNPGYFTIWHDAPAVSLPAGSRLKEGQKVLASYNFATAAGKPNNFNMCMAEPKVYEIVEKQIKWMKENGNPDIYFMGHDEIRIGGWDDSCVKSGKTPGQLLADNVKKCTEIIKRVDPGKPIMAWNDMFDPHHNAKPDAKNFYLVKGTGPWAGSWEGLSSDVGIGNWMQNKLDSLKFFAGRGHQQILAGYYDHDPKDIVDWLNTSKQVQNVVGVMYTTWVGNYAKLEEFIGYVNKWEAEQPR